MSKYFRRIAETLGCSSLPQPPQRTVFINHKITPGYEEFVQEKFPSNQIKTSKYTILTFLPKNLFEQFRRIANFYFLIIGIVQLTIDSPVSPWTTLLPLLFVISVTAVKQVGDIVKIVKNQELPADLVLLSSTDPEGQCHITTANLDGETNLKIFSSQTDTAPLQTPEALDSLVANVECEQPQSDLYKFVGRMNIYNQGDGAEPTLKPLGPENVLLRGCRLKNTPYVFGCAIYTGQETKMALNSKQKGLKVSIIESKPAAGGNNAEHDFSVFTTSSVFESKKQKTEISSYFILLVQCDSFFTAGKVIEDILAFLVLFSYIIPISLYVTLELVKFGASMFFPWDLDLYDENTDEPAKANTSDLIEMLGQIEYLFSDKTGTLTENVMTFRKCSIDGKLYQKVDGVLQPEDTTDDGQLLITSEDQDKMCEFLQALAVCHVVQVGKDTSGGGSKTEVDGGALNPSELEYQASSPDEKALVEAANRNDVIFLGGTQEYMNLLINGKKQRYLIKHILDFDATRKRMSVILNTPDGRTLMVCKGADTAILPRCTEGNKNDAIEHMSHYAVLAEAYDEVENNLHLLGATAIEDKLQDGVHETIEKLRIAGIKRLNRILHQAVESHPTPSGWIASYTKQLDHILHHVVGSRPTPCGWITPYTMRNDVIFLGGTQEYMNLLINGKKQRYLIKHILDFDATRKRMSVILNTPDGRTLMVCKGADTAILPRCTEGNKNDAIEHMSHYAVDGLRTLCISEKYLTEEEVEKFDMKLNSARSALEDRDKKLAEAYDEVENNLHLLGATAIEDKLQEKYALVLELCIKMAGDKVWVLTGDKQETAVNISYSCGHFKLGMSEMYLVKQTSPEQCLDTLNDLKLKLTEDTVPKHALVVDGMSLTYAVEYHCDLFRKICEACIAVLCCRMSPLQKAEVVKLMKNSDSKPITGAIGDGANDCSMIQEAHIGLGIMGKEGRQAVRCSDYAFSRFKFLQKALLVHGHWFYIRVTTLVQYFFYKNFAMITPQFYFAFFNAFSQQTLYESLFLTFYNVTFTSLPILIYGIFEQNLSARTLMLHPQLYIDLKHNASLTWWKYCYWIVLGLYHSVCFFFGTLLLFSDDVSLLPSSKQYGIWTFGSVIMTLVVLVVNIKIPQLRYKTIQQSSVNEKTPLSKRFTKDFGIYQVSGREEIELNSGCYANSIPYQDDAI
uniref:Phospholipid-transporting ATPase n=1 Tax=Saccoglossus kowalevskii TaxID=10224 RepID=A0ABM0N0U6_SACKO|nr:PREDICTED: LOW QUALITY PROTEIN: probable phospholipid-transporting ATPase IF-like [Saccoglossus kowalevskii]